MEIKKYTDEEFFNCKLRGANNVIKAVFGENEKIKNIPPSVLENAAKRGTAVHKCIEDYMNSLKSGNPQEPTIPLEYDIYLYYFNKWREI